MIAPGELAVGASLSADLLDALTRRYGAVELDQAEPARVRVLVTSGGTGAPTATIDQLPALELIAVFGVGTDRVDLAAARARGITVATTPDVLTDDVADLAVALLYATARQIAANDRFVRSGRWAQGEKAPLARRVTGMRIGILGLGRIGTAIAHRLAPVAGEIGYHNRRELPNAPYRFHASPEALADASDVLVLAASSVAGAAPIVTGAVLDALGPDGIFVNIARGGAVDEAALTAALRDGRLSGAGLDVFADEPNVPPALLASDRVVLQPHMGSATRATRAAMAALVLANIEAFEAGRAPPGAVPAVDTGPLSPMPARSEERISGA